MMSHVDLEMCIRDRPVSMDTMDKICKALHCNIGDVMDFVSDNETLS